MFKGNMKFNFKPYYEIKRVEDALFFLRIPLDAKITEFKTEGKSGEIHSYITTSEYFPIMDIREYYDDEGTVKGTLTIEF